MLGYAMNGQPLIRLSWGSSLSGLAKPKWAARAQRTLVQSRPSAVIGSSYAQHCFLQWRWRLGGIFRLVVCEPDWRRLTIISSSTTSTRRSGSAIALAFCCASSRSSPTPNKLYGRRLKGWGHIRLWWKQYQVEREAEGGHAARVKIAVFAKLFA